jgi:tripartite-type tricarboxylate transporter receptor subunit TctC
LVVPGNSGGGADEMARVIQGIVSRHKLMGQPIEVVLRPGKGGAESFAEVQAARGNPHVLVMGLTNLFTTPLAANAPGWREMTPVSMLALDQFVLWVNAASPHRTAAQFIEAAKKGEVRMGGSGSKQEDELITSAMARATGARFAYTPLRGGAEVAQALVDRQVDATVNNPSEAVADWISGKLRPLCVLHSARLEATAKVTEMQAWSDIPTCKEAGLNIEYSMLRGILMPAGVTAEQRAFYEGLFKRIGETPAWRETLENGVFNPTMMSGDAFSRWLATEEGHHRDWMRAAGFLQ